jgi:hypothetical protein
MAEMFKTTHHIFHNEYKNSRNGFAHVSNMFTSEGRELTSARANYTNRTWERFTFQSVMLNSVCELKEELTSIFLNRFKEEQGVNRMTAKNKELFEKFLESNKDVRIHGTTLSELALTRQELGGV